MSIISRTADLFYAYRFIKLLVTPWDKMDAYKLGLLDEKGKVVKMASTNEEKSAYTVFHRLVFNIKRLIGMLPFGKTRIASWATALFLIKEETGMSEEQIIKVFKEMEIELEEDLFEETWFMKNNLLKQGSYSLTADIPSPITGDIVALTATRVSILEDCKPIGYFRDVPIYKVKHNLTGQDIYVNPGELKR